MRLAQIRVLALLAIRTRGAQPLKVPPRQQFSRMNAAVLASRCLSLAGFAVFVLTVPMAFGADALLPWYARRIRLRTEPHLRAGIGRMAHFRSYDPAN